MQQNKSAQHLHPTVHQRINQAVSEIATDVANVSALRVLGNTVPLYENTEFTSKQPAGRRILPIRSVFTDVGYHSTLKLQDKSDPNDKFNVRTEIGKSDKSRKVEPTTAPSSGASMKLPMDSGREERLHPGVTKRIPPTGESGSPESTLTSAIRQLTTNTSDVDSISETRSLLNENPANPTTSNADSNNIKGPMFQASQMGGRLNRELPISDVYHDRNIGLGMAPPLSTLILANNLQVVQVDHHSSDSELSGRVSKASSSSMQMAAPNNIQPLNMQNLMSANAAGLEESFGNIDNLSVIEDAHKRNSLASSARTVIIKDTTSSPPSTTDGAISKFTNPDECKRQTAVRPPQIPPRPQEPWYNVGLYGHYHGSVPRDEGDGRSMTDSQYSGCSPNNVNKPLGNKNLNHHRAGADSLASQIIYMKMRDFLNDQEITVLEEKEVSPPGHSSSKTQNNPGLDQSKMRPRDIANYINTQFKMPADSNTISPLSSTTSPLSSTTSPLSSITSPLSSASATQIKQNKVKRRPINVLPSQQSPLDPRNTQHPQQFWDKNSGFTYTGMFSSDC